MYLYNLNHFLQLYPDECQSLPQEQLRAAIRYGIQRAAAHDYNTQQQVAYYISLMFILGSDFDKDPQYPWAARQIADKSIPDSLHRIQHAYQSTVTFLNKTVGSDNRFLVKALLRLRAYNLDSVPQTSGARFRDDICALLAGLYPQKYSFQGNTLLQELITRGAESAKSYGITMNKGIFVYITLMFSYKHFTCI